MDNTITMTNLSYSFDDNGNTTAVRTTFVGNMTDGGFINTSIQIDTADLPTGKTFDDLNRKDFEELGRTKLSAITKYPADASAQPASTQDAASTSAK